MNQRPDARLLLDEVFSRAFPRSRKNPGPLINALHAWLTDEPPVSPATESWLLGA
jgi:hypothetical protein